MKIKAHLEDNAGLKLVDLCISNILISIETLYFIAFESRLYIASSSFSDIVSMLYS